jgi:hypothetical protein
MQRKPSKWKSIFLIPEMLLVKTEIADQSGKFSFNGLKGGNYRLKISKNGSEVYQSDAIQIVEN